MKNNDLIRVDKEQGTTLVGVVHTLEYLKEHYQELDEELDKADVVGLEGCKGASDRFFYENLRKFALYKGKDTYSIDIDLFQANQMANIELPLSFASFLMACNLGKNLLSPDGNMDTLDLAYATGIAANLNFIKSSIAGQNFLGEFTSLSRFSPTNTSSAVDYRDIVMAENIDKLRKSNPEKRVSAFMGRYHVDGVSYYLDHPRVRKVKRLLYAPIDHFVDSELVRLENDIPIQAIRNKSK